MGDGPPSRGKLELGSARKPDDEWMLELELVFGPKTGIVDVTRARLRRQFGVVNPCMDVCEGKGAATVNIRLGSARGQSHVP